MSYGNDNKLLYMFGFLCVCVALIVVLLTIYVFDVSIVLPNLSVTEFATILFIVSWVILIFLVIPLGIYLKIRR